MQSPGLHQRSDKLLEKEGIPSRFLDQQTLESFQTDVGSEKGIEHGARRRRREWGHADLRVVSSATPIVTVFGAEGHDQKQTHRRKDVDETVDECVCFWVDGMQIIYDDQ